MITVEGLKLPTAGGDGSRGGGRTAPRCPPGDRRAGNAGFSFPTRPFIITTTPKVRTAGAPWDASLDHPWNKPVGETEEREHGQAN